MEDGIEYCWEAYQEFVKEPTTDETISRPSLFSLLETLEHLEQHVEKNCISRQELQPTFSKSVQLGLYQTLLDGALCVLLIPTKESTFIKESTSSIGSKSERSEVSNPSSPETSKLSKRECKSVRITKLRIRNLAYRNEKTSRTTTIEHTEEIHGERTFSQLQNCSIEQWERSGLRQYKTVLLHKENINILRSQRNEAAQNCAEDFAVGLQQRAKLNGHEYATYLDRYGPMYAALYGATVDEVVDGMKKPVKRIGV